MMNAQQREEFRRNGYIVIKSEGSSPLAFRCYCILTLRYATH
jgi:hypothetical protein